MKGTSSKLQETIVISELLNTGIAVTSESGQLLYNKLISLLKEGKYINLDFKGVTFLTTAFLNSAIGQLYSEYSGKQLLDQLKLLNLSSEDLVLIKKVTDRAKEYFASKDTMDGIIKKSLDNE
jgi:hypothetical protein